MIANDKERRETTKTEVKKNCKQLKNHDPDENGSN